MGVYQGLLLAFFICCLSVAMVVMSKMIILYVLSSFLMGISLPGIVTLTSLRLIELVGTEHHPRFWGKVTLCYALSQAVGAYGMSYLLHRGIDYRGCFIIAGFAFLVGLIIVRFTKTTLPDKSQVASEVIFQ